MGILAKVAKAFALTVLGVACLSVLSIGVYWVVGGAVDFADFVQRDYGVNHLVVDGSLPGFFLLGVVTIVLSVYLEDWTQPWARNVGTIAELLSALFVGLAVEVAWVLAIAGILTGPFALDTCTYIGRGPCLPPAPPVNTGLAAIIGATVGLPFTIRWFWKIARNDDRRISSGTEPFNRGHISPEPGAASRGRTARGKTTGFGRAVPTMRSVMMSVRHGFLWIGAITAIGTVCTIVASWNGRISVFHLVLAIVASIVAGVIAALQWRLTSRRSLAGEKVDQHS